MTKRIWIILCAFSLILTVLMLTRPSLNSYFIRDDFTLIRGSYNQRPSFFLKMFYTEWVKVFFPGLKNYWKGLGFIRPIMILSFKIDYLLYGTNPLGYHLTNIFFHLCNGLLVFLIMNALTADPLHGFIGALLFAVHPAHSPGVAWISGRGEVIAATFYLASFYLYMKYRSKNLKFYYFWSVFLFIWGLFAKETVMVLPLMLICYDLLTDFSQSNQRVDAPQILTNVRERYLWPWAAYLVILAAYFVLRRIVIGSFLGAYIGTAQVGARIKFLNILDSVRSALFATPFDYSSHASLQPTWGGRGEVLLMIFFMLFLLLPLVYIGARNIKYRKLFNLGLLWSLIAYLPAYSIAVSVIYVFPLYLYLTTVGIAYMLVALLFSIYKRTVAIILSACLVLSYGAYQYEYNSHYGRAGSLIKKTLHTLDGRVTSYHKGDTIVLINLPPAYKTAWLFIGNIHDYLRRPFATSDIFDDFDVRVFTSDEIARVLSYKTQNLNALTWNEIIGILDKTPTLNFGLIGGEKPVAPSRPPNHAVHLFRWNGREERLEEAHDLAAILSQRR